MKKSTRSATFALALVIMMGVVFGSTVSAFAATDAKPKLLHIDWDVNIKSGMSYGRGVSTGTGIYEGAEIVSLTDKATGTVYTEGVEDPESGSKDTGFIYKVKHYDESTDRLLLTQIFIAELIKNNNLKSGDVVEFTATFDKDVGTQDFRLLLYAPGTYHASFITAIVLHMNDGTGDTDIVTTKRSGNITFEKPIRPGYMFLGWYTQPEGGDKVEMKANFKRDVELYAHWA
jgi:uncharacterized repeat protein (TIGR02543 family)